jgi:arginyl-tRNA synthetase
MGIQEALSLQIKKAFKSLYNSELESVEFQATRKDFEGDITVVTFPMLRQIKMNPAQLGTDLGNYLKDHVAQVKDFNVVKGFLNIVISDGFYLDFFNSIRENDQFGYLRSCDGGEAVIVEYSSPNTNKPLHLGHIRNNLLGYSVSEILKASGKKVYKTQIINDRGIHICKSMLAWKRYGNGETPESAGIKGDKLVGNFYVRFDREYKKEVNALMGQGLSEEEAKKTAPILLEAQDMLLKWEAGDPETVELWKTMNQWVYDGFDITYKNLGVDFDTLYYESQTYLLGKEFVAEGLKKGVFFKKEDDSVWCDLTEDGLDEKIVLRADGTAVYMTQDIGTAIQRIKDHPDAGGMVYTVGNEQDYHFKVLFLILKKLGFGWADNLYHLSYGMVDLPEGKMKSREGTVVDADDLILEMSNTAEEISKELGKLDGYNEAERQDIYRIIGLGALKYFILKVDPRKRILFDPQASVDFQGNTGPFIQYTYARIQAILRKADFDTNVSLSASEVSLNEKEKELIKQVQLFPEVIQNAAQSHSPALIANYTYDLVKEFNSFYQNVSILGASHDKEKVLRVQLSGVVANTIKNALNLLGISVPERM